MNEKNVLTNLRIQLIEKTLHCLEGKSPKEHLIELGKQIQKEPDIKQDMALVQSIGLLEFLAKQITLGNNDVLTPALVQESYTHILEQLTPCPRYIS